MALVCTMASMVTPASAAYLNTGKSFSNWEGGWLFGIGATKYTYKVYKDSSLWYVMFHHLDVCPTIYHSKGKGTTTLTYSKSRTYAGTTAYQFSASIGASVGIPELINLTAGVTGGQTRSYTFSVAATGTVGRTLPSSANTGYYKMAICYNFDKYKLDKYKAGSSYKLASYYPCLPKGGAYVSVLYSKSNTSYSRY